jgi:hypothetical protein
MAGRDPYGRGPARSTEPDPPPQYPTQFNIVEKIVEQNLENKRPGLSPQSN